jgi:hypothetical protein
MQKLHWRRLSIRSIQLQGLDSYPSKTQLTTGVGQSQLSADYSMASARIKHRDFHEKAGAHNELPSNSQWRYPRIIPGHWLHYLIFDAIIIYLL